MEGGREGEVEGCQCQEQIHARETLRQMESGREERECDRE